MSDEERKAVVEECAKSLDALCLSGDWPQWAIHQAQYMIRLRISREYANEMKP